MNRYLIRAVGHTQEDWQRDAVTKYVQQLKPFAKVEVIELPEGHDGAAKPDRTKTQHIEAEHLLKNLPTDATIIALDETGKNMTSVAFADAVKTWTDGGRPVVFLIGGSWGLGDETKQRAHAMISFGKQTMPHLLARIVLLEQMYRAETILAGKMYHK